MRLLVHVEGETEESFVNEVLGNYLAQHGYWSVSARLVGNVRQRARRGGIRSWASVRRGILRHLASDRECVATTMVDYYGLPPAWPGRRKAAQMAVDVPQRRAEYVERALLDDVKQRVGDGLDYRLVPFIMIHEFEALLFSDCLRFAEGIGQSRLAADFRDVLNLFRNPEHINDTPEGAPSKRIQSIMPEYQKPLMGTLAALEIGIPAMRDACPHFASWLDRLTRIPSR